ncbi:hypothetical protein Hdeb2414_s0008g00286291 [Helianthus debilis subsp. tardiflorus]
MLGRLIIGFERDFDFSSFLSRGPISSHILFPFSFIPYINPNSLPFAFIISHIHKPLPHKLAIQSYKSKNEICFSCPPPPMIFRGINCDYLLLICTSARRLCSIFGRPSQQCLTQFEKLC